MTTAMLDPSPSSSFSIVLALFSSVLEEAAAAASLASISDRNSFHVLSLGMAPSSMLDSEDDDSTPVRICSSEDRRVTLGGMVGSYSNTLSHEIRNWLRRLVRCVLGGDGRALLVGPW